MTEHKLRSTIVILVFVFLLFAIAYTLNSLGDNVTAAAVAEQCNVKCQSSVDCDDHNPCTEDTCVLSKFCGSRCQYERKC